MLAWQFGHNTDCEARDVTADGSSQSLHSMVIRQNVSVRYHIQQINAQLPPEPSHPQPGPGSLPETADLLPTSPND